MLQRGALIVLEGCDRAGKTTQCKNIVEQLRKSGHKAAYMNFPNRTTESGKLIDGYLNRKENFTDQGIHLLFTLNRWEAKNEMEKQLLNGTTLIVDRYSYSGVAFSAAKGLDVEWCKMPETGLIKPDLVLYLTLSPEELAQRGGFGDERYEIPEMQRCVIAVYEKLFDPKYWKAVDAGTTMDELKEQLTELAEQTIETAKYKPLLNLW